MEARSQLRHRPTMNGKNLPSTILTQQYLLVKQDKAEKGLQDRYRNSGRGSSPD
jgi:hypothetical protein